VILTSTWWLGESVLVNKRAIQEFDMERFILKKLNDVEVSKRFAASENLDGDDVNINRAWKISRKNMKPTPTEILRYYELKQHKP